MGFPAHVGATADRAGRVELRTRSGSGRRAEGGPTEHTEHTEGFLTGGNGEDGGRMADGRRTAEGGPLRRKGRQKIEPVFSTYGQG